MKTENSRYTASKAQGQILERNSFQDKPLLLHFKRDLKKLNIPRKDDKKLELLLGIIEGEEYQHIAIEKTMFDNICNSLTRFTLFMKNEMKKPVVFVIDETQYILQQKTNNKISLESFYRSSIAQEILSAAMAEDFYLSLFYPQLDGINIRDDIVENDKFPVYTIEWNTRSLINYGDYLLLEMNKNAAKTHCKSLPDFKTLVNYTNSAIADTINRISTPKTLLHFMEKLIIEMNNGASDVAEPFIATYKNVDNAFKKSKE
ncbi:unnamed protein product [Adineta steineri]|uniref:Uncharacterized protein n=1 Tax=Adineta steineri TaxID=433720 RepID=A0A820HFY9_9BILA|nr:unnamed protein product [Adineta steineri]